MPQAEYDLPYSTLASTPALRPEPPKSDLGVLGDTMNGLINRLGVAPEVAAVLTRQLYSPVLNHPQMQQITRAVQQNATKILAGPAGFAGNVAATQQVKPTTAGMTSGRKGGEAQRAQADQMAQQLPINNPPMDPQAMAAAQRTAATLNVLMGAPANPPAEVPWYRNYRDDQQIVSNDFADVNDPGASSIEGGSLEEDSPVTSAVGNSIAGLTDAIRGR